MEEEEVSSPVCLNPVQEVGPGRRDADCGKVKTRLGKFMQSQGSPVASKNDSQRYPAVP